MLYSLLRNTSSKDGADEAPFNKGFDGGVRPGAAVGLFPFHREHTFIARNVDDHLHVQAEKLLGEKGELVVERSCTGGPEGNRLLCRPEIFNRFVREIGTEGEDRAFDGR